MGERVKLTLRHVRLEVRVNLELVLDYRSRQRRRDQLRQRVDHPLEIDPRYGGRDNLQRLFSVVRLLRLYSELLDYLQRLVIILVQLLIHELLNYAVVLLLR